MGNFQIRTDCHKIVETFWELHPLGTPPTILIADDHESSLAGLEGLLLLEGYTVVTARDGETALSEFRRVQPDLLLLDVDMPKLRGTEVCRRIKSNPETLLIPVVLITALTATQDRLVGIEAGADDFLNKPVKREQLMARVRSLLRLKAYTDDLERAEDVLFALARSIEGKDPYTQGHCERLADYSARLGERMGLPQEEIRALRRAGIVHDIGKVAVPDSILLKPSRLTRNEETILRLHPVVGEQICASLKSFQRVLPMIRHHHEKMDGSGYPDGLRGNQIPLTVRVLQIVDVYDALSTQRPYKLALSAAAALGVMKNEVKKGWWDPEVYAEFEKMMTADQSEPQPKALAASAD
jgi:putative two-component system response regulator